MDFQKYLKIILLVSINLVLSACVATPDKLERAQLEQNPVEKILIVDGNNALDYERSNVSGGQAGSLLELLISVSTDAVVNSNRGQTFKSLESVYRDYKPNDYLYQLISNELAEFRSSGGRHIELSKFSADKELESTKSAGFLKVVPEYTVSKNYGVITVALYAEYYKINDKGSPELEYETVFTSLQAIELLGSANDNLDYWVSNPGQTQRIVKTGISDVVNQVIAAFII